MINKRIIKIQELITRQHSAGTASDESLQEINGIVADAKRTFCWNL